MTVPRVQGALWLEMPAWGGHLVICSSPARLACERLCAHVYVAYVLIFGTLYLHAAFRSTGPILASRYYHNMGRTVRFLGPHMDT